MVFADVGAQERSREVNLESSVVREVCKITHATTYVSTLQVLAPAVEIPAGEFLFESGWGKTRAHGTKYGRKYIESFKAVIVQMFNAGNDDSEKKKGPGV